MATSSTSQARRRNGGNPEDEAEFGMEATRNAQETLLRSLLDALQNSVVPWSGDSPAVRGWQRLVDGSAQAVNRFAGTMQGTAEEGTERIKRAVDLMADQIKEGTAQLGQTVEEETNRTRAAASRS